MPPPGGTRRRFWLPAARDSGRRLEKARDLARGATYWAVALQVWVSPPAKPSLKMLGDGGTNPAKAE